MSTARPRPTAITTGTTSSISIQTDTDDASTSGAEFLPNGDIVLHLVDGARGDSDLTADGQISLYFSGPTDLELTHHIVGAPKTWPAGVPLTLASEIGGSEAPGGIVLWQAYLYA